MHGLHRTTKVSPVFHAGFAFGPVQGSMEGRWIWWCQRQAFRAPLRIAFSHSFTLWDARVIAYQTGRLRSTKSYSRAGRNIGTCIGDLNSEWKGKGTVCVCVCVCTELREERGCKRKQYCYVKKQLTLYIYSEDSAIANFLLAQISLVLICVSQGMQLLAFFVGPFGKE